MFKFLLNIVSDNGEPDFEISKWDAIKTIFQEYGTELWFMFFTGLILGVLITYLVLKNKPKNKSKNTDENSSESE